MQIAGLYARYSIDKQKETSIEDQLRRCRDIAAKHGYAVDETLVFFDAAITGKAEGIAKRAGYSALLKAWDEHRFDVLIVDEVSRLARDGGELNALQERIKRSGVRFISADGQDSMHDGWELVYDIKGAIGKAYLKELRHRTIRGMHGQLVRGYMVGYPPFGYDSVREKNAAGAEIGTAWRINEERAALVKSMYAMRRAGKSYAAIAEWLTSKGVAIPRKPRNTEFGGFWRATTVRQLLGNAVYKGLFIWNGSAFARAKAIKEHRELKTEEFKREHLRVIDDETWTVCNTGQVSRTRRGGGKHPFAGLISCGRCGAALTVSQQQGNPADQARLGCARCQQAYRARYIKKGPPYISAAGVRALLLHAFGHVVSGSLAEEFRARLRTRQSADTELGLAALRTELNQANFACRELTRKFSALSSQNPYLESQLDKKVAERHQLQQRVDELEAGRAQRDTARIHAQLDADIGKWLAKLLSPCAPPEWARAVLSRVFPRIVVRKKSSRLVTLFEVTMVLGQVFAQASDTSTLDEGEVTLQFKVTSSAARPTRWTVDLV